jgi:dipeptidyl aminopeptidase/acylaminoacyl peptidase
VLSDAESLTQPWAPHSIDGAGNLFVTVPRGKGGTTELARFDFATGKPHSTSVVSAPGFDFAGRVVGEHDGGPILGFRVETDAETTAWLDPRLKALQAQVDERLPGRVNRLSCRRCSEEAMVALVESFSDRDPGSIWYWRAADKSLVLVGRAFRNLDPARMAAVDFQTITARDGRTMPLWLTRSPGSPADGSRPAIVLVHGGPWSRGGHWRWQAMQQFLASRGYVVIEPEFRGSTGYGVDHFRAGWRQWGRAMQDDIADAVLWAAKQKLIDPQRVCIAGASYGGYATLMGLVRHPEMYRCGAAWAAVTDPMLLLQPSWFWGDDISAEARKYGLPTLLGDAEKDAAMLRDASPVAQAARIKAPVLLAFGELDRRVPLNHGRNMRQALQAAGREPEWITYNSEGHGWLRMDNQLDFARRLEAFFAANLLKR